MHILESDHSEPNATPQTNLQAMPREEPLRSMREAVRAARAVGGGGGARAAGGAGARQERGRPRRQRGDAEAAVAHHR